MQNKRKYDAILWDFDGVIARTELLHVAAWQRVVRHVELDLPHSSFNSAATEDDRDLVARVFSTRGVQLHMSQVLEWCSAKQQVLVKLLKSSPPIYPGVSKTMHEFASQSLRQAIVTSTWRDNIHASLEESGLLDLMEFVISKEDVARPKPSPDGYRLAVQRLGIAPQRCLALEDSMIGIRAAREAGVDVVGIAHRSSPSLSLLKESAGGITVIRDLADLPNQILDEYQKVN